MPTLNELREELNRIREEAFHPDVETDAASLEAMLLELTEPGGQIEKKLDGYLEVIRELELLAEAKKERAMELQSQRDSLLNRSEWLRTCVLYFIQSFPKFNGVALTAGKPRAVQNPPRVEVFDDAAIPEELKRIIPEERKPDLRAIKTAFLEGR